MPLRDFSCSSCGKEQERYFRPTAFVLEAGRNCIKDIEQTDPMYPSCEDCGGSLIVLPLSQSMRRYVGSVFPFVTPHISEDGRPITVESIGHLRSLEKKYGVVLSAFSKNNINDIDPIKDLPRYLGWDEGFGR